MNREQKAATIDALAEQLASAQAVIALDFRGLDVAGTAELRARLRECETTLRVVKNSLAERAAAQAQIEGLGEVLAGPTALAFVTGDPATAAKAIAERARATQLLPFKGGLLSGQALSAEQLQALSRLPAREVLYGQLVGVVASPLNGLARTLSSLIGGLAVALSQVRDQRAAGGADEADAGAGEGGDESSAAGAEALEQPHAEQQEEDPQPTESKE
ncbi:MAG TPA: 50S ribosomal protein L10 [Solirubrobacteraceae bacterium]|nr:50S ribosomal protein L10 [Solirubrobacteraceae bacterium]